MQGTPRREREADVQPLVGHGRGVVVVRLDHECV